MCGVLKNRRIIGVLMIDAIFAIFLVIIFNAVHLYHDDYGYASLSYAIVESGVEGTNYTFKQWVHYFWQHYLTHGGRIVFQGLESLLLKNGAWPMRIAEVFCLVGTFNLIHRIATKKIAMWHSMLFCCTLYGVFSLQHYRTGFYWFSASVLYVIPLIFVFGAIACMLRLDNKRSKPMLFLGVLCAILAGISQEQLAFTIVGYFALMCFMQEDRFCWHPILVIKKYPHRLVLFLSSLVGAGFLLLAPGNFSRAESSLSSNHLERIWSNVKDMMGFYFSSSAIFFTFIFIAFLLTITCLISRKNIISKIHVPITCAASAILLAWCIIPMVHSSLTSVINEDVFAIYLLAYVTYSIYLILCYLWSNKDMPMIALFGGGLFCQFSMLLYSPYIVARMTIVFYMVMFVLFTQLFASLCSPLSSQRKINVNVLSSILIVLLVFSGGNIIYIATGYYGNHDFLLNMEYVLRDISARVKDGEDIAEVEFDWVPNPDYCGDFGDGTEYYMHEYYDLPEDFNIKYPLWE